MKVLDQTYQDVLDIDANINRLVRKIELLSYVNPINIAKSRKEFFASKFTENPKFKYPKLDFNPYKLQRLFFSQRLERIKDDAIRGLYEDIIYEYSGLIQCIETIGKEEKFYYNSLRSFGTPKERDVQNAKFILHFDDDPEDESMIPHYNTEEAVTYFKEFSKLFDFEYHIKTSNKMSAAAMVLNNQKTLVLRKNSLYSRNELETLATHEIGVHLVTTFNGLNHPLKIFSHGFPKNVETQEGLAVFSEYMTGCLTLKRLKELAYRVIAIDSLSKGYDFAGTFDVLHNQYKLEKNKAFNITLRAHRGGGFTKDYLYLTGLRQIYKFYKTGQSLDNLLTGKVSLKYLSQIEHMQDLGLANSIKYANPAYQNNNNINPTVDFILESLK